MQDTPWRQAWDEQADDWIAVTQSDPWYDLVNEPQFLDLVPAPGALTLEIGCGEGRMSRALRRAGHTMLALDGSTALARAASRHAEPVSVAVGDIHCLPLRDAAADLVVCFMVLMDIDDLDVAMRELARVLTPRGRCCFAILHPIMTSGFFMPGDEFPTFYMGEYLAPMRHVLDEERHDGSTLRVRVLHRPIDHYSRALEQAGFVIEAIRETKSPPAAVEQFAPLANYARVPNFLYVLASKTAA